MGVFAHVEVSFLADSEAGGAFLSSRRKVVHGVAVESLLLLETTAFREAPMMLGLGIVDRRVENVSSVNA